MEIDRLMGTIANLILAICVLLNSFMTFVIVKYLSEQRNMSSNDVLDILLEKAFDISYASIEEDCFILTYKDLVEIVKHLRRG